MLVLSRKRDEEVIAAVSIDDLEAMIAEAKAAGELRLHLVTIQVVKICGNMTRLGFNADKRVDLVRKEVLEQRENEHESDTVDPGHISAGG